MASQHFYSRIPARVSMFNRVDGFDTFACSSDVSREFCDKELSNICSISLSAEDAEEIRLGNMPPVYAQFSAKTGELVQSCLSFLPVDYSGERSAYFVHSLIFGGDEKRKLLANYNGPVLDPGKFLHDISSFSVTDPDARPDPAYPFLPFEAPALEEIPFPESVSGDMRRRWIGAVLALLCGKIKTVFVSHPAGKEEEQTAFLCTLFNATLQILPYHLRDVLSFATHVSTPNQLPFFRIRGIPLLPEQVKAAKSAVISFDKKVLTGLPDEEISRQLREVDFFCRISEQNVVRREFLRFAEQTVSLAPALGGVAIQTISDLILLFQSGCEYPEYKPPLANDDAVLTLISLYEKYRNAIPDEYRIRILAVLERYPKEHREIPKKVFTKLVRMYPNEIYGSRRLILKIVLELIHTDLMREKLMSFLNSIIDKEEPEAQCDIALHLARVMYGGFLQSQILSLFSRCYPRFDEDTRTAVLEKILLIIRTKSVREQVIAFFDEHAERMNDPQKKALLDTVFEQLGEGDDLAAELIAFLNRYAQKASEAEKEELKSRIYTEIDRERRKADLPLVKQAGHLNGFFAMTVAEHILFDLFEKKIFREWLHVILSASGDTLVGNLIALCDLSDRDPLLAEKFSGILLEEYDDKRSSLSDLNSALNAWDLFSTRPGPLSASICTGILSKQIRRFLRSVFSSGKNGLSVEEIWDRISSVPLLLESEEAEKLRQYLCFRKALSGNAFQELAAICDAFSSEENWRAPIAGYMAKDLETFPSSSPLLVSAHLFQRWLASGGFGMDEVYQKLCLRMKEEAGEKTDTKNDPGKTESFVIREILHTGVEVWEDSSLSDSLRSSFLSSDSGLREVFASFLRQYNGKGKAKMELLLTSFGKPNNRFIEFCEGVLRELKPKRGLFAWFRKK